MSRVRRQVFAAFACLLVGLGCVSCGGSDAAVVGNIHISREVLERELGAIAGNPDYVSYLQERIGIPIRAGRDQFVPAFVAQILTNQIRAAVADRLLGAHPYALSRAQAADARLDAVGGAGSPRVFGRFPRWYQQVLISRSTTTAALRKSLAPETAAQYFEGAKSVYVHACEWDIVTKTRDDALAARARVVGGESFQSVARDVSLDKGSGPRGGNLACNERDNLLPELDQAAFTQPVGVVSQPIETGEGDVRVFHLLLVSRRYVPQLSEVKGEVQGALDKLGTYRLQSEMRARLVGSSVKVARDLGSWDASSLIVLPPSVGPATPSPAPRPRPLPPIATSPAQVNPSFQVGQQVFITDAGVRPLLLYAIVQEKITWINRSNQTATVRFVAGGHEIGPIPAGGSASYTPPTTGSIAYTLLQRPSVRGAVQVQWYFDPGEDPGAPNRLNADTPEPSTPSPTTTN